MGGRSRNSTSEASRRPRGASPRAPREPRAERVPRIKSNTPENALRIADLLAQAWPDAVVELDHQNAYQLLVATILSAQSTDKMINTITPGLFAKYPDAMALAAIEPAALEPLIFKSGFYRNKAKALVGMARALVERHGGKVPETMAELVELPGVARKTGNVVLSNALGKAEGIVVDTHVIRLSQRLGLTKSDDPVDIEQDLMKLLPQDQWGSFSNRLIWHGRRVCMAKNPDHEHCILAPVCPTYALVQLGKSPLSTPKKNGKAARSNKAVIKKPLAKKPAKKPQSKARTR